MSKKSKGAKQLQGLLSPVSGEMFFLVICKNGTIRLSPSSYMKGKRTK